MVYALRNSSALSNLILQEIENIGEKTSLPYQRRLPSNTIKDYYFIHRDTGQYTQPVMIIYGSVNNPDEAAKLKSNALEYAEAVVKAVMKYIGKPYIPQNGIESNTYIVQNGDTLYQIANRYNTTVAESKHLNQLTSDMLQIGQVIKVPDMEEQNDTFYTVKSGDSLYKIANTYDTTVSELMKYNNLSSNLLQVGQVICIPKTVQSKDTYVVQRGDTLYQIANQYNTTVTELKRLNQLTSDVLQIGQVIKVPNTKEE